MYWAWALFDPIEFFKICTFTSEISVNYRQRNLQLESLGRNHVACDRMNHTLKFLVFFLLTMKGIWSNQLKPDVEVIVNSQLRIHPSVWWHPTVNSGNTLVLNRAQNQDWILSLSCLIVFKKVLLEYFKLKSFKFKSTYEYKIFHNSLSLAIKQ